MPDRLAIVTFKDVPAGELREAGSDTYFVYADDWSEPIACGLPAGRREHYHRGGLIPFFEHLAPEGWLRGRQARAGGTAEQDDFGLLLNYGADCIGAVGIRDPNGRQLAKGVARATTLDFASRVQPDDFRIKYREIVRDNARRIFA